MLFFQGTDLNPLTFILYSISSGGEGNEEAYKPEETVKEEKKETEIPKETPEEPKVKTEEPEVKEESKQEEEPKAVAEDKTTSKPALNLAGQDVNKLTESLFDNRRNKYVCKVCKIMCSKEMVSEAE